MVSITWETLTLWYEVYHVKRLHILLKHSLQILLKWKIQIWMCMDKVEVKVFWMVFCNRRWHSSCVTATQRAGNTCSRNLNGIFIHSPVVENVLNGIWYSLSLTNCQSWNFSSWKHVFDIWSIVVFFPLIIYMCLVFLNPHPFLI